MADIFISYTREDVSYAERLAAALEAAGVSVWWDRSLRNGSAYHVDIEAEIDRARRVIVLWSERSRVRHWVLDEATAAQEAGKLAPVVIDGRPPLGFRSFHGTAYEEAMADVAGFLAGMGFEAAAPPPRPEAPAAEPPPTGDLRYNMKTPLAEAMTGALRDIAVPRDRPCGACGGRGCAACKGAGAVETTSTLRIKVPAGVRTGTRIRLAGEGGFVPATGETGDLYIFIEVENGIYAVRDDLLVARLPMSAASAAAGFATTIPDLRGGTIPVEVPKGAKAGQEIRLEGKGFPALGSMPAGDILLYVEIE